jgi:hypothetical protein
MRKGVTIITAKCIGTTFKGKYIDDEIQEDGSIRYIVDDPQFGCLTIDPSTVIRIS